MPHVRLLTPVTSHGVIGAAGDVLEVDARTASDLVQSQRAVLVRGEERRTAVVRPDETT